MRTRPFRSSGPVLPQRPNEEDVNGSYANKCNEGRTALLSAGLAHGLFHGVWRLRRAGDRARIRIRPRDRRHEAVASPRDSGHIPGSRLPVLKRPTQGSDMEPQVALLDRDIWPDSRHQPLLADNFTGAFDKNDKNVERSSTQMNWAARLLKVSLRWAQAKWTERNRVRGRSGLFVSHLHSLNIFGGRFASQPSSPRSAGPMARMRPDPGYVHC
jgi:hypothetical protein